MLRPQRLWVLFAPVSLLALAATAEAVYARPMDYWSVAWFFLLTATGAIITFWSVRALVVTFRRSEITSSLDGFVWLVFWIVPFCVSLCAIGIWTLCWYFLSWE